MGLFSSIFKIGKKLVGRAGPIGKKIMKSPIGAAIGKKISEKAADVLAGATGKLLDSGAGKAVTGAIHKGAEMGDAMTGGALGLKRKAEELESGLRSGKLAKKAVELAGSRAARHMSDV